MMTPSLCPNTLKFIAFSFTDLTVSCLAQVGVAKQDGLFSNFQLLLLLVGSGSQRFVCLVTFRALFVSKWGSEEGRMCLLLSSEARASLSSIRSLAFECLSSRHSR